MKQVALFAEGEVKSVKTDKTELMAPARKDDYWISDLVGALCDPIITWPSPWNQDLPEWLFGQIKIERLLMNMKAVHGERPTGTDAEALAYMMPLTLERPIDSQWTRIYLYLGKKVCSAGGKEWPKDKMMEVEPLDDYDMKQLNELKDFIYRKRIEARKDKDRQAKREKKEEKETAAQEIISEQMPLL